MFFFVFFFRQTRLPLMATLMMTTLCHRESFTSGKEQCMLRVHVCVYEWVSGWGFPAPPLSLSLCVLCASAVCRKTRSRLNCACLCLRKQNPAEKRPQNTDNRPRHPSRLRSKEDCQGAQERVCVQRQHHNAQGVRRGHSAAGALPLSLCNMPQDTHGAGVLVFVHVCVCLLGG